MCQYRVCYGDLLVKLCTMSAIATVDSWTAQTPATASRHRLHISERHVWNQTTRSI